MKRLFLFFFFAFFPIAVLAADAPSQNCDVVMDAHGDVDAHTSKNVTIPLFAQDADIASAKLTKKDDGWDLDGVMIRPIEFMQDAQVSLIFLFDRDRDIKNNAGRRIDARSGFDMYYALNVDQKNPTATTTRFYFDTTRDTWKKMKTNSAASLSGAKIYLHVPFEEMPADPTPRWRLGVGLGSKATWTASDVAPDVSDDPMNCGYVLATTTTKATLQMSKSIESESAPANRWLSLILVLMGLGGMGVALVASKRKG